MICRMSRLADLDPVYAVSYGNQMDLTLGDYLEALVGDEAVDTVACYVEGFADLDGLKTARLAHALTLAGRRVILYKAGRSAEGQSASAGHTASIAGDYETCRQLLPEVGVELAETFDDFEHRARLARALGPWRGPRGRAARVAVVSNAGFECVGIADNLAAADGRLELAVLAERTRDRLRRAFVTARLDSLVDVRNPLDLTPMATDAAWGECVSALLEDPGVDAAIISIVPLTAAMQTLPVGAGHREDLASPDAIAARLAQLKHEMDTPFVCAVDSGVLFDPLVRQLEGAGIPVFRHADEATRCLRRHLTGQ
jgi:acyl-CoA synthetase (NDP forming)